MSGAKRLSRSAHEADCSISPQRRAGWTFDDKSSRSGDERSCARPTSDAAPTDRIVLLRQSGRVLGGGRQQLRLIGRPQKIEPHRHRGAHPQRILTMVVVGALGQRMDENVEAFTIEHQPRHDFFELSSLEDDVELRNWVWASRFIAEGSRLYGESSDDCVPQALGDPPGRVAIIDMSVIAFDFGHATSPLVFTRYQPTFPR